MINYIRSEFYRLLRNRGAYFFILVCSALITSAHVVLAAVAHKEAGFSYANTSFAFSLFFGSLPAVFLLCVTVVSIVFGNEYSNHTLKNSISYGISRGSIYFGKLIVEIIYAMIAFAIITGVDIGTAYLLLEDSGPDSLELLFKFSFVALPELLFSLAATNCFLFILESNGAAIAAIMGTTVAYPIVNQYLGLKFDIFAKLNTILPWNIINKINFDDKLQMIAPWAGKDGYTNCWLFGMLWMVIFVLIGFVVFRRKEVK
jgi:ABC-type transport system involved in multi-copper enzyme maturation permease subunit